MKMVRLAAGITALAGIAVMCKLIVSLIKEHRDNKYIYSQRWDSGDY